MHSLPGVYWTNWVAARRRRYRLVSAGAVKELCTKQGGSAKQLAQDLQGRRCAGLEITKFLTYQWLQTASLEYPCPIIFEEMLFTDEPFDRYAGMCSVSFPSPHNGQGYETGRWCRGCQKTAPDWQSDNENEAVLNFVAGRQQPLLYLDRLENTALTETQFLAHLRQCPGAAALVPSLKEQLQGA